MAERRSPLYKPFLLDAIRAGDKTNTRRVMKPQPEFNGSCLRWPGGLKVPGSTRQERVEACGIRVLHGLAMCAPHGQPGDVWGLCEPLHSESGTRHADGTLVIDRRNGLTPWDWPWKRDTLASMFMPQWAARDFVTVTGVRAERLQDISEADAKAEGVDAVSMAAVPRQATWSRRQDFSHLWDSINGKKHPWASNPFVWVYTFGDYQRDPGRKMPQ